MKATLLGLLLAGSAQASVRLLFNNDLENVPASALLISENITGNTITQACGRYNEQPLSEVTSDIQAQLGYLVYAGDLQNSSQIYIASGSNTRLKRQSGMCSAYTVGTGATSSVDCSTQLPLLCTNSPGPTILANNTQVPPNSDVYTASNGSSFIGFRDARSFRFLGIPFAAPPVGDLRFQAAQPYTQSYNNFRAQKFGASCVQPGGLFGVQNTNSTQEDCLTLNVYTPAILGNGTLNRKLPVAFWIYGGAFSTGNNSVVLYDGSQMSSRGDVVVVVPNYRLGVLGNLASNTLAGAQCITDQIQALKWVQQHISAFGGDPDKVTIFGESAGSQSVLALMSSTPAKGLFRSAIGQSAPWAPLPPLSVYSDFIYKAVLNATDCNNTTDAAQLECLRNLSPYEFLSGDVTTQVAAASSAGFTQLTGQPATSVEPLLPVYGTGVVDGNIYDLVQNGTLPFSGSAMIGNCRNEGLLFVDIIVTAPLPNTTAVFDIVVEQSQSNATAEVIEANPSLFMLNSSDSDSVRNLAADVVTLDQWQCPLQQFLDEAYSKKAFSGLYSFVFDKGLYLLAIPDACAIGKGTVCHSADIAVVFGTGIVAGVPYIPGVNPLNYTQYVNDVWTSFIRTGEPTIDAAYVNARGSAYQSSLELAQAAPFNAFSPNSLSAIQLLDFPPTNSPILSSQQCSVLSGAGFAAIQADLQVGLRLDNWGI